ncbi:MAG TPA: ribosome silencing factor [Lentisphaeria bacterium]|nr:MAG: ribosome silencing factor [Lentisphaerae bacterium GWF2_38_69]HBM16468.1 ribosome silencing factor [Lentisphaeria bacterium]
MFDNTKPPTSEELANFCALIAEDRKAEEVVVIKLGEISSVSEIFVICSGTSAPHLGAISEWIQRKSREQFNIKPVAIDGAKESEWVVIDFGNVMVHIFSRESREKYNLENLWSDAEKIEKLLNEKRVQR